MPFQRQQYYEPSRVDTGQAQVYGSLANRLSEFSQRAKQTADTIRLPEVQAEGAAAARSGDTKLKRPWTAMNRAYNDALVRAYALDKYAEMHQEISRIELESGTSLEKFKIQSEGYRSGAMKNVLPEAVPLLEEAFGQRMAEGALRIGTLAATEERADTVAKADRGRQTMLDEISRGYSSGTPEGIAAAEARSSLYINSLLGDVAAGLKTQREADAAVDKFHKDVARNIAFGQMEAELAKPGGDPIKVIEDALKHASPIFSEEEKTQLVSDLYGRLNQHQALSAEAIQQQDLALKKQHEEGYREAVGLFLDRKLTISKVSSMFRENRLSSEMALRLENELKAAATSASDDEQLRTQVELNVLRYEEDEILGMSGLSFETRRNLIRYRRELEEGWQGTKEGTEAAERIGNSLGIKRGVPVWSLTTTQVAALGNATQRFYDMVEALPPAERAQRGKLLEISSVVIATEITNNIDVQIELVERNKERAISMAGDGEEEQKLLAAQIKGYNDQIAEWKEKRKQQQSKVKP